MIFTPYVYFSLILFSLGLVGILLHRKNLIYILMCLELILLGVNTNFIACSVAHQDMLGQVFVFFVLTVAAAEMAVGLSIIVLMSRRKGNIDVLNFKQLKG